MRRITTLPIFPLLAGPSASARSTGAAPRSTTRCAANGRRGATLLELLIVLGFLGIMSSLGALGLRPPPARLAANAVQAVVQQARFEAIRANRPMVVAIDAGTRTVRVSSATDAATVACGSATLVRTVPFAEGSRATVDASAFPIVWLPSGQPRRCDGTPIPLGACVHTRIAGFEVGPAFRARSP
jgi:hypothetical protein